MLSAAKGFARFFIMFFVVHSLLVEFFSSRYGAQDEPSRAPRKPGTRRAIAYDPLERLLSSAFWYQPLVRAGNRGPRNRFLRIVTLSDQREPNELFANICRQRVFMARLIKKLQAGGPSVIVVDKYFSPDSCPDSHDPGNQMLAQAISSTNIPIVLGVHTLDADQLRLRGPLSQPEENSLKVAPLVTSPGLKFDHPSGLISYGLIRLNYDNREIPLEWRVYQSRSDLAAADHHTVVLPTLSLVAAERADPNLSRDRKLKLLLSRGARPYTSFLSEDEITTFSALDLLCGPQFSSFSDWEHCELSDYENQAIRNHVVIIGDSRDDQDIHPSVIGLVPGVVLQANYIESLLDDRYLIPVPYGRAFAVNLALSLAMGWLLYRFSAPGGRLRKLLSSLLFIFGGWIFSYVLTISFGYYFVIWFPAGPLVVIWARKRRLEKAKDSARTGESAA